MLVYLTKRRYGTPPADGEGVGDLPLRRAILGVVTVILLGAAWISASLPASEATVTVTLSVEALFFVFLAGWTFGMAVVFWLFVAEDDADADDGEE